MDEARVAARRAYGNVERARQMHREERSVLWLEQLRQDVRYTMRAGLEGPWFAVTSVIIATLQGTSEYRDFHSHSFHLAEIAIRN